MDRIEELRKQYYESIKLLQNESDIISALPQPEYESFFPIINGVIKMLDESILITEEELQKTNLEDREMLLYIQEELKSLQYKKNLCTRLLEKGLQDKKIEEEAEQTPKKNIIFATTESGNVCIENDLKSFPEEYYESVENSLRLLQDGFEESNSVKGKQLIGSNKVTGLHEIKEFKVRVIYKNLSEDTVYVLMARMKKSTSWTTSDRREIIERSKKRNKQFEMLKEMIKDPIKKAEIIAENSEIIKKIYSHISQNKR